MTPETRPRRRGGAGRSTTTRTTPSEPIEDERREENTEADQREPNGERAQEGLASATLPESLGIVATGVLPAIVRGLFKPRRRAMKLLGALDADRRAVALLSRIRGKYGGEGVRVLNGRLVVLWGAGAIREVLDRSATLYASDGGAKAKGMAHFQPDAVTVSRGEAWRDRRTFNESVLATDDRVHPFGRRFVAVVENEVDRMALASTLEWRHWEGLFDKVTLRVIFGDGARSDQRLTGLLERLMGESNRLVGLHTTDDYYALYGALESYLKDPRPESLVARFAEAPQTDTTRVVHQIPHWMFAMRDTLAANTYRALAAIVADDDVQTHVRDELAGADLTDPAAVDGMRYLEGCLHEAMRLWPTTPLLARETTEDVELAGEPLDKGTQVLMLNAFNHRDAAHVENADRLEPGRWAERTPDYRFNHLSNGAQDCPGGPIVLLLGKAVIAQVLDHYALSLERPKLAKGEPLPHMLNFFEARFSVRPRDAA
jgi:cytochrome P450